MRCGVSPRLSPGSRSYPKAVEPFARYIGRLPNADCKRLHKDGCQKVCSRGPAVDAPPTSGSSNPGISAESCRSPVRKWNLLAEPLLGNAKPRAPASRWNRPAASSRCGLDHGSAVRADDPLSQLLQRPLDSGMRRHVDVRQSPISMLDEHEHVEYPERHGHRHEEIAGDDGPGVISQERRPALIAARPAW
jgi:hypothetical protein